jgi:Flp pilus assembly pilin Flp
LCLTNAQYGRTFLIIKLLWEFYSAKLIQASSVSPPAGVTSTDRLCSGGGKLSYIGKCQRIENRRFSPFQRLDHPGMVSLKEASMLRPLFSFLPLSWHTILMAARRKVPCLSQNRGATAIEYGLIAAAIGVGILAITNSIGDELAAMYQEMATFISNSKP